MLRRLMSLLRDSPTYGQDRVNLISASTIGFTSLILNGVVLCLVLPLMANPNDSDFRTMTENVGFGQLLALILLGGATVCAGLAVPVRLAAVFSGPRIGRYFDQVVLSGISPLRFVIGKALSQNLFLMLILFLLIPWMVLSLSLGGVHPGVFLGSLFLIWLYCMALALVTLWASVHMNEGLAAVGVVVGTFVFALLGLIPMPFNPMVMTPVPALIHPVYSSIPSLMGTIPENYLTVFASCAACLVTICGVSAIAVYLGPLYGLIAENSTFGEVVRRGDSKKKTRLRLRLHIQRPSEMAFFYENRGPALRPHEGLIRWGAGFLFLLLALAVAEVALVASVPYSLAARGVSGSRWWIYDFHTINLTMLGFALAFAIFLFSHARNTVFQRQAFVFGRGTEVGRLDSIFFLLFLLLATAVSIGVPFYADSVYMAPAGGTMFPSDLSVRRDSQADFVRVVFEGSLVIAVCGLTIYMLQRLTCLHLWLRSASLVAAGSLYCFLICMLPLMIAILLLEFPELRHAQFLGMDVSDTLAPVIGMISPFTMMIVLFGEGGNEFPQQVSVVPFYAAHAAVMLGAVIAMKRAEPTLRQSYFTESVPATTIESALEPVVDAAAEGAI